MPKPAHRIFDIIRCLNDIPAMVKSGSTRQAGRVARMGKMKMRTFTQIYSEEPEGSRTFA
jgi:hypothetical protein